MKGADEHAATRKRIGAAAVVAALVITFHLYAEADADAASLSGRDVQVNGVALPSGDHANGGILSNGRSLSGAPLNGARLDGARLNDVSVSGAKIHRANDGSPRVQSPLIVGRTDGGSIVPIEVPDDRQAGR